MMDVRRIARGAVALLGATVLHGVVAPEQASAAGGCPVFTAVAAGNDHSVALASDGTVWTWGANNLGQLGDGTVLDRSVAAPVWGLRGATSIAAGMEHSNALSGGYLMSWGGNSQGQSGNGMSDQPNFAPVAASHVSGAVAVAAGSRFSFVIESGGVKGAGQNGRGELGDGTDMDRSFHVQATGLTAGSSAVEGGAFHSLAVVGGAVKSWGENERGALGDGTTTRRLSPDSVTGLGSGATAVAAGNWHSLAIVGGAVKAWGDNSTGQLGDNLSSPWIPRLTPVAVAGLGSGASAVAAGTAHSLAIVNGAVKGWGNNGIGQLGDGTTTARFMPVDTVGLTSGATAIAAGDGHSLAVVGGTVLTWGRNHAGQLGDGTTTARSTPGPISCAADTGVPQLSGTYASDDCDAGTNVVSGFVQNTYVRLRHRSATTPGDASIVCVAAESGGIHLGGRITVLGGALGEPADVDDDASSVAACAASPGNVRVQSGTVLGGQPYWIDVAPTPPGSNDAAWVCVRFTSMLGYRVRVAGDGVVGGTGFYPDPLGPHLPPYVEEPWPTGGPSATCDTTGGPRTRHVSLTVGSIPVRVFAWHEAALRHLCVRAGSVGGAGGRLTLDMGASPGVSPGITTTNTTDPCPFDVITRADAPAYGLYISDPAQSPTPPASACVTVGEFALGVTAGAAGEGTLSWTADPA